MNLDLFNPGDKKYFIFPEGIEDKLGKISVKAEHEKVKVRVPSRLTTTILDTNRLSVNRPGGGMLAIGVDGFYTEVSLTQPRYGAPNPSFLFESGGVEPIVYHTLSVLSEMTGFNHKLEVSIRRKSEEHVGLASSAMLSLASAVAFNELVGCPFTNREIRKIIGYNYVEVAEEPTEKEPFGKVSYGINTGSSHAIGLYGGVILMTTDLEMVSFMPFPENEEILLYIPKDKKTKETSGEKEAERLFDYVRELDRWQAQGRVYKVFMDLIPAMRQRKSKAIGNFLEDTLVQGHQQSLFSRVYNYDLLDAVWMFREQGANMCGISSGGPTIFATGDRASLDRIQENLVSRFGAEQNEIYLFKGSAGLEYLVDDSESKQYKLNIEDA